MDGDPSSQPRGQDQPQAQPQSQPLALGLLCTGGLLFGRHALLISAAPAHELATWLLANSLPERLIEAVILGVLASTLAHRVPGLVSLGFNAAILAWAAAGIPWPNVGAAWPLALLLGGMLALLVTLGAHLNPRVLRGRVGLAVGGLVGLALPLLLMGGTTTPTWEVELPVRTWPAAEPHAELSFEAPPVGGPFLLRAQPAGGGALVATVNGAPTPLPAHVPGSAQVRLMGGRFEAAALLATRVVQPQVARPDAPGMLLVLFDGAGVGRTHGRPLPSLAGTARRGLRFTRAVAAAPTRAAAIASILGGERRLPPDPEPGRTLAEVLAAEGFVTGLFGPRDLARPTRHGAGFQTVGLDATEPEAAVLRAARWMRGVAGARFLAVVVLATDAPSSEDVEAAGGDAELAGLRAADSALGLLYAHLEILGLEDRTVFALVGTVEAQAPEDLRQGRLHVPLVISGPGFSAGQTQDAAVEARTIAPTLAALAGLAPEEGGDLTRSPRDVALFNGLDGARGVRQGDWTLWVDGPGMEAGEARLFQVESDPAEVSDLAGERPDRVEALRALLPGSPQ